MAVATMRAIFMTVAVAITAVLVLFRVGNAMLVRENATVVVRAPMC